MNKVTYNIVGSTIKVTASSKVDVSKDLENTNNNTKTIAELLDEQEQKEPKNTK